MAHAIIGGGDLTKLRGYQSIPDAAFFVTPLVEIVTGTIGTVPARYPFVTLIMSWDGATTGISVGQLVKISNGDTIRAWTVVRKAVSGTNFYISETSLGGHGYPTMIESPILAGDTVTVYSHRPLWGMYSRIDAKTKVFYKMWDVPYATQNEGTLPIANTGTWQGAKLEGDSAARFTLPKGGTNTSFAINGTVSSNDYEWALPSGVTLVAGYAEDDAVIEVDAEVGNHLLSLTVFTGGNQHTAYCWLFVSDNDTNPAFSESFAVSVPQNDSQNRLGRSMSVTIWGENLQDVLFPSAGVLFREWPDYNGSSLTEGVGIDSFVGYISEVAFSHDGNIGTAELKIEAPLLYASRVAQAPQSLEEKTEATKWTHCESGLSNPCGFAYYLIKHHSPALLDMHDFIGEAYETPRIRYLQCPTRNLGDALQVVAGLISGNIGSASDGTTVLMGNPLYLGQTDRDAFVTTITLQEQDIAAPFEYQRRGYNQYAEARGGAFAYGGTGLPKAFYVGRRWGQGAGNAEMPTFVVTTAQGLTEAKTRIGHFFAEQNAEIQSIGLQLIRNFDIVDPAYMCWIAFTLSSSYDPYGLGFASNRLLPDTVTREWELDDGGIKKRISVSSQGETFGQMGEELPVGNVKGLSGGGWTIGTPEIWNPHISPSMFSGGASLVLIANETGEMAVNFNYLTGNPTWTKLNSVLDDEPVSDFCFDYGSPYFAGGGDASQSLGVYALTIDGVNAHIWYFADILRSATAESIKSLTLSDSTLTTNGRIACSETYPLLVLAGFKDNTGTRYSRSTDGGVTFGSLVRVGSAITDTADNENAFFGLAVDGQRQLISAPDATPVYGTYYASTAGGAFSKLASSQDSAHPQSMIAIEPEGTIAYVTSIDDEPYTNEWDGSDYFSYGGTVLGGGTPPTYYFVNNVFVPWTYDGIVAGGVSGNALKLHVTNPHSSAALNGFDLQFDWTNLSAIDLVDFSFDVYYAASSGSIRTGGMNNTLARNQWHHVRASTDDPDWPTDYPISGNGFTWPTSLLSSPTGLCEVYFDNVIFYLGEGAKLWKVTAFPTAPVWTNISPVASNAPERPYDFAVDLIDPDILNTTTRVGMDWYKSTNKGTSWTSFLTDTAYRAVYTAGDGILTGGDEALAVSFDGGDTLSNIEGDITNVFDAEGIIKHILIL